MLFDLLKMNSNQAIKISAVIIAKNEEKNIGRCLTSLAEVADEIIVVDSFSTDATESICRTHHVRFEQRVFDDYSSQKNYGNSLATYPYILSLDADEALSEELKASILSIKSQPTAEAYYCHRLTNYCGQWIRHCGWYPDTKLRFFDKTKAQWKGKIHEKVHLSTQNVKMLQGDLLHYSFESIAHHASKTNHFTEMAAQDLFAKGKKASLFKIIFGPAVEFLKVYILKRGFLDGFYGFVIAVMSSYYIFYKYAKLKDTHYHIKKREPQLRVLPSSLKNQIKLNQYIKFV